MPSSNSNKWPPYAILKRISGTLPDFSSEKTHLITGPCYPDLLPLLSSKRCSASIVHFLVTKVIEQIFKIKANIVTCPPLESDPYQSYK